MALDIVLVSPPSERAYGRGGRRIKHGMPPLGLACLNGIVKSRGYRTRMFDLADSDTADADVLQCVRTERPRFLGVTAVTAQVTSAVRFAQAVKRVDASVMTVLGGPHPSALPELTISYPGVDCVVSGEGELPVLELLGGRPFEQVSGLTWFDGDVIRSNPRPPAMTDLDAMPRPDFEGLPVQRYRYIHLPSGAALPVMSGRGCPYRCVFCASSVVAQRRCRFLSPSRFVDHIEDLVKRYAVRNYDFVDETFVMQRSRVRAICDEILTRKLRIRWVCQTRVNGIDVDTMRLMRRAGCRIMQIGIESGDQSVLDRIGKGIDTATIRESCRTIKRAGLRLTGFFILGLPHDTPDSVRRTIEFAKELPLDLAQFAMFTPLPGSAGWDLALDGDVLRMYAHDWDDFSRYTYPIVESDALSREQLKTLHDAALREFYYRPRMMLRYLLGSASPRKFRSLLDKVVAFAQIVAAKRLPPSMPPMPRVTRGGLGRLITPLGRTDTSGTSRPIPVIPSPMRVQTDEAPHRTLQPVGAR